MAKNWAVIFERMDKDDKPIQAEYLVECDGESTAVMMAMFNVRLRKESDWAVKSVKVLGGD